MCNLDTNTRHMTFMEEVWVYKSSYIEAIEWATCNSYENEANEKQTAARAFDKLE